MGPREARLYEPAWYRLPQMDEEPRSHLPHQGSFRRARRARAKRPRWYRTCPPETHLRLPSASPHSSLFIRQVDTLVDHSQVVRPRVARLLGRGLGWVEGEAEHKRMKRLIAPSLSPENIKGMAQDVRNAASVVRALTLRYFCRSPPDRQ